MAEQEQNQTSSLNLSDEAMAFLGLSQQPFSASILSSHSIFLDTTLEQLIDTTKHHLQFSDLLLIIEGEIGSGKTTLFRHLLQNEVDSLFLISIPASATFTLTQIQQTVSVHLKDQGDANYLEENLKRLQVFDQTPVLVIDDAHVLADTTLQELLRYQKQLETEHEVKLKILMLANKGMAKTIETISNLQHNQLYVQELPAYSPKQIHSLLLHRLNAAGYTGEDYFNNDRIQSIFKKSNGTPLQIMQQAITQLETIAKKQSRSSSSLISPITLLASLGIIICIGIAIYFLLPAENTSEQTSVSISESEAELETVNPEDIDEEPIEQDRSVIESSLTDHPKKITPPTGKESLAHDMPVNNENNISLEGDTSIAIDAEINNEEKTSIISDHSIEPDKISTPLKTSPTPEPEAQPEPQLMAVEEIVIKPEIEPIKPAPIIEKPVKITSEPVIEKQVEIKPEPLDGYLVKLNSFGLHDPHWIMQQNSKYWTLQIIGARYPFSLYKFAKQHKLNQNSAWFKTDLSGKPWYILVHGVYTNKETARQAMQNLPASLKQSKPWVKSIGTIQKSIKP